MRRLSRLRTVRVLLCGAALGALLSGMAAAEEPEDGLASSEGMRALCAEDRPPQQIELAAAVAQSLQSEPDLIIAQANAQESRSDLMAAKTAFLPSGQFQVQDQRYVPSNGISPVVVVGNTVLGGAQTKSAYGSLSLSWNLMDSGRDVAAYRSAKASVRSASSSLDSQLEDTLMGVLQAYADLYEAEVGARNESSAVSSLESIQARAEDRYAHGHGTLVAIGQARAAAFDEEEQLNQACRTVADKSAALARAIGIRIPRGEQLTAGAGLPMPIVDLANDADLNDIVESDPAVAAAKENIAAAQSKLQEAQRSLGPTVSLYVRRDYLGESVDSFGEANRHIAPYDSEIGLSFQQELFPFTSEVAQIDKASAEVRKAQAQYEQAQLETETKLRGALSAQREAQGSFVAAKRSLAEAERVLDLTESLYHAGRTDLDNVDHARMDRDKAQAEARTLESRRTFAEWAAARVLEPDSFPSLVFGQLHLDTQAEQWRREH